MTKQNKDEIRRENGAGTFTNLSSGNIRYQGTAKMPNGDTIYKDDGTAYRLSGTGTTKAKAKKSFQKKVDVLIKELEDQAAEKKAFLEGGVSPSRSRMEQKKKEEQINRPFCDLFLEYLNLYKSSASNAVKAGTYDNYLESLERIRHFFGDTSYAAVDQDAMQSFINWLSTPAARRDNKPTGLSPKTILNTKVPIAAFTAHFSKKWKLPDCCEDLTLPAVVVPEMRVMTEDEMDIFIREIRTEALGVAMYLALFTGMRLGELLALTWDDLDMKNRRVRINKNIVRVKTHLPYGPKTKLIVQNVPKSKKSIRTVRVPLEVFELLIRLYNSQKYTHRHNPDNLMFPTKYGTHTDPRAYQKRIKAVVQRCGEKGISAHTLRHTFATRLSEQNVPPRTLQELLGHASLQTTMRYTHTTDAENDKAVDTLDGRISRALKNKWEAC